MGVCKINKNFNDFSEQDFQDEVSQEEKSNEEIQSNNSDNISISVSKEQIRAIQKVIYRVSLTTSMKYLTMQNVIQTAITL